jgi:SRSO17 transposase
MLAAVRGQVVPALERHGPISYWIVDDSGMPKQGKHSVGVARQYCGNLGKRDNLMFVVKAFGNDSAVFASIGEGESRMTAAQRRRQDH